MWIFMLILLLLAAQLNVTAIVPSPGRGYPTALVGRRQVAQPFAVETRTLLPRGDLLNHSRPSWRCVSYIIPPVGGRATSVGCAGSVVRVAHRGRRRALPRAAGPLALWLGCSPSPRGRCAPVVRLRPARHR